MGSPIKLCVGIMQTKLKLKSKRNYDIVMLILYSFEDIDLEELLWQTDEFSPTIYAPLITTTMPIFQAVVA